MSQATLLKGAMALQNTVLYAAKDTAERAVRAEALRKAGLMVREATTGNQALAGMAEKADLILLEVDLPDMSGFELCRRLKAAPGSSAIPVLMLSASFSDVQDRMQALAAGADDYLIEPIEPDALIQHIRNMLTAPNGQGSSESSPPSPSS